MSNPRDHAADAPDDLEAALEVRRAGAVAFAATDGPAASPGVADRAEILELRTRVRELSADLNTVLHHLATIREHLDALFASHRWRLGSRFVDAYLRLRRRRRPPTAENHLRALFRGLDDWEARRRSLRTARPTAETPAPPAPRPRTPAERRRLLFYRLVEPLLDSPEHRRTAAAFARSEEMLLDQLAAAPPRRSPLVSVILPTYERAHVLGDAIRSVLEQSYESWELIVSDDGSTDATGELVAGFADPRIQYRRHGNSGAAAARNRALAAARGELVAYLDSDNIWHPDHLRALVGALEQHQGHHCAYAKHLDVEMDDAGARVRGFRAPPFDHETLAERNFVDLNAFVHRRELTEALGGFDERLRRQQDWDLVLRYSFPRDPLFLDLFLVLYRRNSAWGQITDRERNDTESPRIVVENQDRRYAEGLTVAVRTPRPSVSIVSWDVCRNHFSKAYNLAEALSADREVELVGFRFFGDEVFAPYADAEPAFPMKTFGGGDLPAFFGQMTHALASLRGDVVYAVKPRLPSLGLALLANFHFGKPVVLEINDLESEVADPLASALPPSPTFDDVGPADPRLLVTHHPLWSQLLEGLAFEIPALVTHNENLDRRFGAKSYQLRNPKDEQLFDPGLYSRDEVRHRLGIEPDQRVLLFGGMVRHHKGVLALARFVDELADDRYRLLVVGSRETPDSRELEHTAGSRVRFLPPRGRNVMAQVNLAADAAVLWLDPTVAASHYQMPFKLTDALAMELPVIANPMSDLADLGRRGVLRLVDYGDFDRLATTLEELFSDPAATRAMTRRGRRLYLRQFGYRAVRAQLELLLRRHAGTRGCLPAAERFETFFADVYRAAGGGHHRVRAVP